MYLSDKELWIINVKEGNKRDTLNQNTFLYSYIHREKSKPKSVEVKKNMEAKLNNIKQRHIFFLFGQQEAE